MLEAINTWHTWWQPSAVPVKDLLGGNVGVTALVPLSPPTEGPHFINYCPLTQKQAGAEKGLKMEDDQGEKKSNDFNQE